MKILGTILVAGALAASAVHAASHNAAGLHWGEARPLGSGTARAWVAVDVDGTPAQMGVSIDEAAMRSRPQGAAKEAVLPLPAGVHVAASAGAAPAFRVIYDERSRSYVVVFEGIAAPQEAALAAGARSAKRAN
uniref:Uncharacterized protein n=1 Tax=Eiseniibacteriota bacterium TaxID=2212470 RepID=A0A832ICU5_UNCEI